MPRILWGKYLDTLKSTIHAEINWWALRLLHMGGWTFGFRESIGFLWLAEKLSP